MTNNITITNLKKRKKEIKEELEFKDTPSLNEELYEINDTLKKLGAYESNTVSFN